MRHTVLLARTEDLARDVLERTARWPKRLRVGLTSRLEGACVDLAREAAAAEVAGGRERRRHLHRADELLAEVHLLLRIARDLGCLSAGAHRHVGQQAEEIGRLLGGWLGAVARSSRRG